MTIVPVPTAIPAFIGYTEKAEDGQQSLIGQPFRVGSPADYTAHFGGPPRAKFTVAEGTAAATDDAVAVRTFAHQGRSYRVTRADTPFLLCHSLMLFFQNGGGECDVVSVGAYDEHIEAAPLLAGLDALADAPAPTLVVVPDAMRLSAAACAAVQQAMLAHCGAVRHRFAILDVRGGYRDRDADDPIAAFRRDLGTTGRDRAAAYYPWLHASIVQPASFDADSIDVDPGTALFSAAASAAASLVNLLPPAAALAGVYAMVDATRGVWKAPANVALAAVAAPAVAIADRDQDDLNVAVDGASINAIRSFPARGAVVWGARTLDGNSADWRFVNVRRTTLMIEESIRLGLLAFAAAPNDASTWMEVKRMIEPFLTAIWRDGGLMGTKPEHAFAVRVGAGETMTADDVLSGRLLVEVFVAMIRPAEFIVLRFQQQTG